MKLYLKAPSYFSILLFARIMLGIHVPCQYSKLTIWGYGSIFSYSTGFLFPFLIILTHRNK